MVLVDSSSWIHLLRPNGDPAVRGRVEATLRGGLASWCPIIRLEMWNGAGGEKERKVLRDLERELPELPIDEAVWDTAYALARRARQKGVTVSASDLLIAACARRHGAEMETSDSDFELLSEL